MPDAQEIVFIPGLNNSASVWTPVLDCLPGDVRGRSVDCPPLEDVEEIAATLLAELPKHFLAVGHSFGGYVALAMLAQQPDRLSGVVLVNSNANADSAAQAVARRAKGQEALQGDYAQIAMANVDRVYHPDNAHDPKLLQNRRNGVREYGATRFAAHCVACSRRADRQELLANTAVPILVVAANDDQVIPLTPNGRWPKTPAPTSR